MHKSCKLFYTSYMVNTCNGQKQICRMRITYKWISKYVSLGIFCFWKTTKLCMGSRDGNQNYIFQESACIRNGGSNNVKHTFFHETNSNLINIYVFFNILYCCLVDGNYNNQKSTKECHAYTRLILLYLHNK